MFMSLDGEGLGAIRIQYSLPKTSLGKNNQKSLKSRGRSDSRVSAIILGLKPSPSRSSRAAGIRIHKAASGSPLHTPPFTLTTELSMYRDVFLVDDSRCLPRSPTTSNNQHGKTVPSSVRSIQGGPGNIAIVLKPRQNHVKITLGDTWAAYVFWL
jgi:hypothetical protein